MWSLTELSLIELCSGKRYHFPEIDSWSFYTVQSGEVVVHDTTGKSYSVSAGDAPFRSHGPHELKSLTAVSKVCRASLKASNDKIELPSLDHFAEKRAAQKSYVKSMRDMLLNTIAHDDDFVRGVIESVRKLEPTEAKRRADIFLEELVCREQLHQIMVRHEESRCFAIIKEERHSSTVVPWCTQSCRYCCMTRQAWAEHQRVTQEALINFIESCQFLCRGQLEDAEREVVASYTSKLNFDSMWDKAHTKERSLLVEEESLHRNRVLDGEDLEWQYSILKPWDLVVKGTKAQADAAALRERYLAALRIQDGLGLRERRNDRRQLLLLLDEEAVARRHMVVAETTARGVAQIRALEFQATEKVRRMEGELDTVSLQRDELLEFQQAKRQEEASDIERKEVAAQQALEDEFKELKRLKKGGASKGNALPPCPNCGLVPAKDLLQHRMEECPERPTQCTKCDKILRLSVSDEHKTQCPKRVEVCPQCNGQYTAAHLETSHLSLCVNIQKAKQLVVDFLPVLPFLAESTALSEGVLVKATTSLDMPSIAAVSQHQRPKSAQRGSRPGSGSSPPPTIASIIEGTKYVIFAIDEAPVNTPEEFASAAALTKIGKEVMLTFSNFDGETSTGQRYTVPILVGTSIPFTEYKALVTMIGDDEANVVKPQGTKKAKK